MRTAHCSSQVVLALGMLMHGCTRSHPPQGADASAEGLEVGQVAPEIVGQDLEGVPFKLSDYRGRVVVLDFWGNW
jgi:hypothetical protein